ncbi:MAG: proline racemase family protein [Longimicrobiales bacterium]
MTATNGQLAFPRTMRVIDSHTEGEPTRVVVDGWPALLGDTMQQRRADLLARFDHLRSTVVCEPRGHDAIVGALLTEPVSDDAVTGVIFFNNVGCLGMCGHGLIGVVRTLAHLARISPGVVAVDTPVGTVSAELHGSGEVTIRNVPSRCHTRGVQVDVPGVGVVTGDVAYGGNWFFIAHVDEQPLELSRLTELTDLTTRIRAALVANGITGADNAEIDHIELYQPLAGGNGARNFVMCPGGAYDRSPCGTGTSAKLAALHAAGELKVGDRFVQQSVTGGEFTGWLERDGDSLIPYIRGSAHVTGEATLYFDPTDPFIAGFTAAV